MSMSIADLALRRRRPDAGAGSSCRRRFREIAALLPTRIAETTERQPFCGFTIRARRCASIGSALAPAHRYAGLPLVAALGSTIVAGADLVSPISTQPNASVCSPVRLPV